MVLRSRRQDEEVARRIEVSKKWLRARDTYGVEVSNVADVVLLFAVTVTVDALAHD